MTPEDSIKNFSGVGAVIAKRLEALEIKTAKDLLFYFPFRYDQFSQTVKIKDLQVGVPANIVGRIELIQNKRSPRRRLNITEALIADDSETIKVVWFNQPFLTRTLQAGDLISLAGKPEEDYLGLQLVSPQYEKIYSQAAIHTQGLVPNYHLTANISQKQLRSLIKRALLVVNQLVDWLPLDIARANNLLPLAPAITQIHFPKNQTEIDSARKRLAFDELLLVQLQAQLINRKLKQARGPLVEFLETETKQFVDSLPFKLTDDQRKAAWEILLDLQKDRPMTRLLEGDVGSGKTVVAAIAMMNVAKNQQQAALMVPTEMLARQHFQTLCRLFDDAGIRVGLVTRTEKRIRSKAQGPMTKEEPSAKAQRVKLSSQEVVDSSDIVIGTHALIQDDIRFKNLALAVVDEQHRFGVEQRRLLVAKAGSTALTTGGLEGFMPHLLSMTATPIPRSLALALYGDLDISLITHKPANRLLIKTELFVGAEKARAYELIKQEIIKGRQAFVICPLIDWSDKLGAASVKEEYAMLSQQIFPDMKIAMLHGRMKSAEKNRVMQEFLENKIQILIATSIIEVGIDIPNASVMLIANADRFGLAQLHQYRGRVGRAEHQSFCFLLAEEGLTDKARQRLGAMLNCDSGFELAKIDLQFRGPGEVYGLAQKGFPELKIASLFDYDLMRAAKEAAVKILDTDPDLSIKKFPNLLGNFGD